MAEFTKQLVERGGFGPRVYLRCVAAVILRRRATFLSLAFAS